ncbi:MAG: outer membrane receptor protein involved in Fe transport [Hyphomicrobiaceae bacterium]
MVLLFAIALTVPNLALGDQLTELPPVVVEADAEDSASRAIVRSNEVANDSTGFVESIDMRSVWRGTEDIAEILDRSTSVRVRSQGGRETRSTLSIRGARSGQVRILLDGVPLGRANDPVVDLATLPASMVERIDLHRGFTPLRYAAGSGASLINIITRTASKPSYGAALSLGSYGTGGANGHFSAPWASGTVGVSLAWRQTDGDFDFLDDGGTRENPFDDRVRPRKNNNTESLDAGATWTRPLHNNRRLVLRNTLLHRDEGVPGLVPFEFKGVRLRTFQDVFSATIDARQWSIGGSILVLRKNLHVSADEEVVAGNETKSWTADLGAHWQRVVADRHLLEASVEGAHEDFEGEFAEENASFPDRNVERDTFAIAVGDEIAFDTLDLTVSLQLRHQQLWNHFEGETIGNDGAALSSVSTDSTDPRLGLRWAPLGWLTLKANASTWFRPPTLSEQFGSDGFARENPALKPEDGKSFDVGAAVSLSHQAWKLGLEYAWFANDTDDIIVVSLDSFGIPKANNLEAGQIRGHEVGLRLDAPRGWSLSSNYTYQDSRNVSPSAPESELGRQLPGVAREEFSTRLAFGRSRWLLAWETQFTGRHFSDIENTEAQAISSRLQHDVSLVLGPWRHWQLAIELENLTDSLVPDDLGFPLPGRSVFATLSWLGSNGS